MATRDHRPSRSRRSDLDQETRARRERDLPAVRIDAGRETTDTESQEGESAGGPSGALLQYLDRRQNEVLAELDQLSGRIEALITRIQQDRDDSRAA